ncbi:MAG: hypothetical protein ETSY1_37805 [Candidatus Entotheonella factor]|uniref:Uncharacterized protein n=1 Tax=Entotheonella factor TaxID=1429438 RepID=W4L6P8_ENTF1|nr:MAG: hypothetical protein ETSY1_37805 [Candidatus Entotheonella factor]
MWMTLSASWSQALTIRRCGSGSYKLGVYYRFFVCHRVRAVLEKSTLWPFHLMGQRWQLGDRLGEEKVKKIFSSSIALQVNSATEFPVCRMFVFI